VKGMACCDKHLQTITRMQAAVDAYGTEDEELWLRYIAHMQQRKKSTGQLHWRASKMLRNPERFLLAQQEQR
jgi:hypothetical protein